MLYKRILSASIVCALVLGGLSGAGVYAQVEEGFERIQFTPGREAAIRTKSNVVRGLLSGITREKVTVITGVGTPREKAVDLPLKTVTSIRTSDGEFQYKDGDDFVRLTQYAVRLDGVTIEDARITAEMKAANLRKAYGLETGAPDANPAAGVNRPPIGGFPSSTPTGSNSETPGTPVGGFSNTGGFGGGNGTAPGPMSNPPAVSGTIPDMKTDGASTAASPAPVSENGTTVPSPTAKPFAVEGEIITCSNCKNEVAYNSSYGMRCPHCNIEWVADVAIPEPVLTTPGSNDPGVGGTPVNAPRVVQGPVANGGPIQLPPPPSPVNTGPATPQSFDLATMPLWMKATFFLGSMGLIYYFAFYLR